MHSYEPYCEHCGRGDKPYVPKPRVLPSDPMEQAIFLLAEKAAEWHDKKMRDAIDRPEAIDKTQSDSL